jgi:hypothetical protein
VDAATCLGHGLPPVKHLPPSVCRRVCVRVCVCVCVCVPVSIHVYRWPLWRRLLCVCACVCIHIYRWPLLRRLRECLWVCVGVYMYTHIYRWPLWRRLWVRKTDHGGHRYGSFCTSVLPCSLCTALYHCTVSKYRPPIWQLLYSLVSLCTVSCNTGHRYCSFCTALYHCTALFTVSALYHLGFRV